MRERLEAVIGDQALDRIQQPASRIVSSSPLRATVGRSSSDGADGVVEGHGRESPLG
jgi:hypothetical protein